MSRSVDDFEEMAEIWGRPLVVEFLGTFALIFAGAGSIIVTQGQDLVAIGLAHGLAIGLFVAAAGHISGGVYNPAVAIGLLMAGKLPPAKTGAYIVAQLLGALIAAALLKAAFPGELTDAVDLGTPLVAGGFSVGQAFLLELIMTFFLVFVIFGVAIDRRGPNAIAGLAIGLTITMDIFLAGPATGAAMNPARWFGPALIATEFDDFWVYWLGPIIGAVLAAGVYGFFLLPPGEAEPAPTPAPTRVVERERPARRPQARR